MGPPLVDRYRRQRPRRGHINNGISGKGHRSRDHREWQIPNKMAISRLCYDFRQRKGLNVVIVCAGSIGNVHLVLRCTMSSDAMAMGFVVSIFLVHDESMTFVT